MTRLDRLNAILLSLRSRRVVRGEEIAEEFGISLRTVYRDIKSLMESGVPIYSEAGYGYSLDQDYMLRPVQLSDAEASAVLLGTEFVASTTDKSIQESAKTALRKIQAILPETSRDFVERLQGRLVLRQGGKGRFQGYRDDVMAQLNDAIVNEKPAKVRYYSKHREIFTERTIEPLGLFYHYDQWHVAAYCRWRKSYRDFRVDRIEEIALESAPFKPHHDFQLSDFLAEQFKSAKTSLIRARFTREAAARLKEKHYFSFVREEARGEDVVFEFHAPLAEWIATWILSFGLSCRVIEPEALKDMVRKQAEKIAAEYS